MVTTPGKHSNGGRFLGGLTKHAMATDDFFRARLDQMIDLRHPLAVLSTRMPWAEIEMALAPALAQRDRKGRLVVLEKDDWATLTKTAAAFVLAAKAARG